MTDVPDGQVLGGVGLNQDPGSAQEALEGATDTPPPPSGFSTAAGQKLHKLRDLKQRKGRVRAGVPLELRPLPGARQKRGQGRSRREGAPARGAGHGVPGRPPGRRRPAPPALAAAPAAPARPGARRGQRPWPRVAPREEGGRLSALPHGALCASRWELRPPGGLQGVCPTQGPSPPGRREAPTVPGPPSASSHRQQGL